MVSGAPSARYGWSLCGLAESLRRQTPNRPALHIGFVGRKKISNDP
jgi:hypothetical protein